MLMFVGFGVSKKKDLGEQRVKSIICNNNELGVFLSE